MPSLAWIRLPGWQASRQQLSAVIVFLCGGFTHAQEKTTNESPARSTLTASFEALGGAKAYKAVMSRSYEKHEVMISEEPNITCKTKTVITDSFVHSSSVSNKRPETFCVFLSKSAGFWLSIDGKLAPSDSKIKNNYLTQQKYFDMLHIKSILDDETLTITKVRDRTIHSVDCYGIAVEDNLSTVIIYIDKQTKLPRQINIIMDESYRVVETVLEYGTFTGFKLPTKGICYKNGDTINYTIKNIDTKTPIDIKDFPKPKY